MDFILSEHVKDMLKERNIPEDWVWRVINNSDLQEMGSDENLHYYKSIDEFDNRILHVVVNANVIPKKIVTVFFDRRKGYKN